MLKQSLGFTVRASNCASVTYVTVAVQLLLSLSLSHCCCATVSCVAVAVQRLYILTFYFPYVHNMEVSTFLRYPEIV